MATILNQANLTYTYGTTSASVLSNPAVTERIAAIAIEKRSLEHAYRANASLTYLISVENSGAAAVQNLAVHDDLGVFTPAGASAAIRPLTYTGPAVLYLDGELTETLSPVADETGVIFTIPNLPANAAALIVYSAQVNDFAPLETGSTITNTASIALADGALTASATVPVESYANVMIEKEMSPNPVEAGGTLTVTFTIENFGNVPATDVVLTDAFPVPLDGVAVTVNGASVSDFTFENNLLTLPVGTQTSLTVPAAIYTTDASGAVTTAPGVLTVVLTGTI